MRAYYIGSYQNLIMERKAFLKWQPIPLPNSWGSIPKVFGTEENRKKIRIFGDKERPLAGEIRLSPQRNRAGNLLFALAV